MCRFCCCRIFKCNSRKKKNASVQPGPMSEQARLNDHVIPSETVFFQKFLSLERYSKISLKKSCGVVQGKMTDNQVQKVLDEIVRKFFKEPIIFLEKFQTFGFTIEDGKAYYEVSCIVGERRQEKFVVSIEDNGNLKYMTDEDFNILVKDHLDNSMFGI